jgi:hypothetical protein
MYEQHKHRYQQDKVVWVRSDLKGKHRSFCLCYSCDKFKPGDDRNCVIAEETFANCLKYGITTPVFECPEFSLRKDKPYSGRVVTLEEAKACEEMRKDMAGSSVIIRSREHGAFWGSDCRGYTENAWQAGIYSFKDAFENTCHCGPEKGIEFLIM